jgi:hypothetical protein
MVSFRIWMLGVPGGVKIVKGICLYTIHNQHTYADNKEGSKHQLTKLN